MKELILGIFMIMLYSLLFSQTIKIGYFQAAPYVFQDNKTGEMQGATYELLEKKVGPAMGVKFDWAPKPIPIARQLILLGAGKLDASAMFAKNQERSKMFVYPSRPYFISHPILAVNKRHTLHQVKSIDDILALKIGFCGKSYISPFMRDKRIKWDLIYSSNCIEQNLKKLIANRFDAQYQPSEIGLLYYTRSIGVDDKIRLVPLPEEVQVYIPFSKAAAKKYLTKFDLAMDKVNGVKAFKQYLSKYINIKKLEELSRK